MSVVSTVLQQLLWLYWLVLMARLVLGYVVMLARDWRPRGLVLVLVEGVYSLTDPPLRVVRKVVPPLRMGGISLDLAFLVLMLVVLGLMRVVAWV